MTFSHRKTINTWKKFLEIRILSAVKKKNVNTNSGSYLSKLKHCFYILQKRGYAAQAAVKQSTFSLPAEELKVTTLPSGGVVASVETNAPVSRVSILFK